MATETVLETTERFTIEYRDFLRSDKSLQLQDNHVIRFGEWRILVDGDLEPWIVTSVSKNLVYGLTEKGDTRGTSRPTVRSRWVPTFHDLTKMIHDLGVRGWNLRNYAGNDYLMSMLAGNFIQERSDDYLLACAKLYIRILAPDMPCRMPGCDKRVAHRTTGIEVNWVALLCPEHRDWAKLLIEEESVSEVGAFREKVFGREEDHGVCR